MRQPPRAIRPLVPLALLVLAGLAAVPLPAQPQPRVVVIDPGHGGDDPGVRAPGGALEKDLSLQLAEILRRQLEADGLYRAILTRSDDRNPSLRDRAMTAHLARAEIFLSLHAASSPRRADDTFVVYHYQADATRAAAFHELRFDVGGRPSRLVPWSMAQQGHVADSRAFAEELTVRLRPLYGQAAPPPVGDCLRLLETAACPAVLVEYGFLSSPAAETRLQDPTFQESWARTVAAAIRAFLAGRPQLVSGERP